MKQNLKFQCALVVSLVLIVGLSAVPVLAQDVIKIGAIYSMTGPVAAVAKLQQQGTTLAAKEVNEAGGVDLGGKKVKLEIIFADDQAKSEIGTKLFEDMVRKNGITAVIGGSVAHIPLAINHAAKQDKALFIATCASSDAFYQREVKAPTVLGILASASDIGRAGASYLVEKMKPKRVAFFVPAYAFGQALVTGFEPTIKKHPEITYKIFWHPFGSTDIKRDLEAVRDFKPDVVAIGSWGQDAVNALNRAFEMGLGKGAKLFHLWTVDALAVPVNPDAMKGVIAQMFWYHNLTGFNDEAVVRASDEFTAKYKKEYNEPPEAYGMVSYFAVKEAVRAMELAKSTDPTKMYEALMSSPQWNGAKGQATWRKDGRCMYKYFDWVVEGKGPNDRKEGMFGSKYDFAKVVDAFSGDAFAPTLQELGY
jgi:branched-chain amino acid transport system substrate-binding protein